MRRGVNADVVVETAWGDDLGKVISSGRCRDFAGDPQHMAGHSRDRYIYSPCEGEFSAALRIGEVVSAGQEVARIGTTILRARRYPENCGDLRTRARSSHSARK